MKLSIKEIFLGFPTMTDFKGVQLLSEIQIRKFFLLIFLRNPQLNKLTTLRKDYNLSAFASCPS
jgi:hypothetical protein